MKLPKMRGKFFLWQLSSEIGEKKIQAENWRKKNCGNGIAEMEGKKMCQLICGNVVAEMEGNKKRIVAMELPKIGGERERERKKERIVQIKKKYFGFLF